MMADAQSRKPIPTGERQIEHLKQKGVFFVLHTEMEAARIRDPELFNPTQLNSHRPSRGHAVRLR